MVDELLRQNPENLSDEDRAQLGCLPDRLTPWRAAKIAYPLGSAGQSAQGVQRKQREIFATLEAAMKAGALKFEQLPDTVVPWNGAGSATPFRGFGKPRSIWGETSPGESFRAAQPAAKVVAGVIFLHRDDVAAWLKTQSAWPPKHGDGLRRWWPELDEMQAVKGRMNAKAGAAGKQSREEKNAERKRQMQPFVKAASNAYKTRAGCKENVSAAARYAFTQNQTAADRDGITITMIRKALSAELKANTTA